MGIKYNNDYDKLNSILKNGIKLGNFSAVNTITNETPTTLKCKEFKIQTNNNGEIIDLLNCNEIELSNLIENYGINESTDNNKVFSISKDKFEIITNNTSSNDQWLNNFKEKYEKDENVIMELTKLIFTQSNKTTTSNDKDDGIVVISDEEDETTNINNNNSSNSSSSNKRLYEDIINLDSDEEDGESINKKSKPTLTNEQSSTPIKFNNFEIILPRNYKGGNIINDHSKILKFKGGINNIVEYYPFNSNNKYKIKPITSGIRISLFYKLSKSTNTSIITETVNTTTSTNNETPQQKILSEISNEINNLFSNNNNGTGRIVYICNSEAINNLEKDDKILLDMFKMLCKSTHNNNFKVYSSNLRMEEVRYDRFGNYDSECDRSDRILENIMDLPNGNRVNRILDIGENNNIIMPRGIFEEIVAYDEDEEKDGDCEGYEQTIFFQQAAFLICNNPPFTTTASK